MALAMHSASVPIFVRMLGNLVAWLDKAEAHARGEKFEPQVYLSARLAPDMLPLPTQIQIACDAAKFCIARLAGVEAPPFADDEKSLAELRQRVRKTIDYLKSVPAAQIDGSDAKRDLGAAPHRRDHDDRRGVPEALRAAELLLPRDDDVRAAAPQRRRARQDGLPRRAAAGRRERRLSSALAARALGARANARRDRLVESGGRSPRRRRVGLGLVMTLRDPAEDLGTRRCQSSCSDRVTAIWSSTGGGGVGVDIEQRVGEVEPGSGDRSRRAAAAERRRQSDARDAPAAHAEPVAEPGRPRAPMREGERRDAFDENARRHRGLRTVARGRLQETGEEGAKHRRQMAGECRLADCSIWPQWRKAMKSRGAAGQFGPAGRRRVRSGRRSPCAAPCTSTTARRRRRA